MLGNIGDLFVKCMRQVTKGHLYHLLGLLDCYVMYYTKKHRGGCTRVSLRPGHLITTRARSVRVVIKC